MTTRKRYPKWPFVLIAIGLVLLTVLLVTPDGADAHTPNPAACTLARDAAPPGSKYHAQQVCLAAQRRHLVHDRIARVTRACLRVDHVLGVAMCHAIATVKPAWATSWYYHELLDRESSGSTNAVNERSGACGSFQRLPCPWKHYGGTSSPSDDRVWSTALEQTRNGVLYIENRYGDPARAIHHHDSFGWY